MTRTVRLATRGSELALRQAQSVAAALESRRREVELVEVSTTGDDIRDELIHQLGMTGAFVRSLDEEVLAGEVDAAVHSMKDVPTEFPEDLVVAGVPERASAGDVLVTPDGTPLSELPDGARIGTASLRRRAQLLAERSDLSVEPLRGNVDTRLEKLLAPWLQAEHERRLEAEEAADIEGAAGAEGDGDGDGDEREDGKDDEADERVTYRRSVDEWFDDLTELERQALGREVETRFDGIVLAAAGLERLGLLADLSTESLGDGFVSAPGQGAIAVSARDGDLAETLQHVLDHPRTRVETTVERTILETLGGGCVAPLGIYAVIQGEYVHTRVRVLSQDGTEEVAATRDLPVEQHPEAARAFAADLAEEGAAELVESARRESV